MVLQGTALRCLCDAGPAGNLPGDWGRSKRGTCVPDFPMFHLRAKLYTADLESGLHYLLRVELAAHRSLAGAELKTLREFVTVVAKVWVALLWL